MIGIKYIDKIAQIKNSIKMWRRRLLTPLGKNNCHQITFIAKNNSFIDIAALPGHRDFKYYQWHFL